MTAGANRAALARSMSEADLLDAVLAAAAAYGWLAHHSRPARVRRDGADTYRTAVAGDPGLPDLILAHPRRGVLFRELKSERGTVGDDQLAWLDALTNGGANAGVWRPTDWVDGLIDAELRGPDRQVLRPGAGGPPGPHTLSPGAIGASS